MRIEIAFIHHNYRSFESIWPNQYDGAVHCL